MVRLIGCLTVRLRDSVAVAMRVQCLVSAIAVTAAVTDIAWSFPVVMAVVVANVPVEVGPVKAKGHELDLMGLLLQDFDAAQLHHWVLLLTLVREGIHSRGSLQVLVQLQTVSARQLQQRQQRQLSSQHFSVSRLPERHDELRPHSIRLSPSLALLPPLLLASLLQLSCCGPS